MDLYLHDYLQISLNFENKVKMQLFYISEEIQNKLEKVKECLSEIFKNFTVSTGAVVSI